MMIIALVMLSTTNPAKANSCGHAVLAYVEAEHNLQQAMANPNATPGEIAALQLLAARARAMVDTQCHDK
jgi:phosphoribosylformylglycinamidine (FGAM) synthase-like amidotransferase family enzyme